VNKASILQYGGPAHYSNYYLNFMRRFKEMAEAQELGLIFESL
jgi:hypothetical protein